MFCTEIRCVNLKNLLHSFAGINYLLILKKHGKKWYFEIRSNICDNESMLDSTVRVKACMYQLHLMELLVGVRIKRVR